MPALSKPWNAYVGFEPCEGGNLSAHDVDAIVWLDIGACTPPLTPDNTLYSHKETRIMDLMEGKIRQYFHALGLDGDAAEKLHKYYYHEYGLAIRGLMKHHTIDPLDYDRKCDMALPLEDILRPCGKLIDMLRRIDKNKFRIYALTNAYKLVCCTMLTTQHAKRVLRLLQLDTLVDAIVFCDYTPESEFYLAAEQAVQAKDTARHYFVDDSANNVKAAHRLGWQSCGMYRYLLTAVYFDENAHIQHPSAAENKLTTISDLLQLPRVWPGATVWIVVLFACIRGFMYLRVHFTYREDDWNRLVQVELPKEAVDSAYAMNISSTITLTPAAFPPPMADTSGVDAMKNAYAQGDPHAGVIQPKIMALLQSPPVLASPPWPAEAPSIAEDMWSMHPWSFEKNGSKTLPADALHPERQAVVDDWRPSPYNRWTPPLANLSRAAKTERPRIQFAFENEAAHSGRIHDPVRDSLIAERQNLVKSAFIRAWQGYKKNAWGADELRPVSQQPNNNFNGWGATIVDALDTLLVMGLHEEYNLARNHVHDIDFYFVGGERSAYGFSDGRIPVFETAIRYLGGFLSAYDLTADTLMRDRAEELAQLILPAFDTLSGLPVGRMVFDDKAEYTAESPRGKSESVVLAEATSMLLEFTRLWQVTGNRTYFDRVQRVTDFIDRNLTHRSAMGTLLPTHIYPEQGSLSGKYTLGGQTDSYYEYLVKEHQLTGGRLEQYARMYSDAVDSAFDHLLKEALVVPTAPSLALSVESYGQAAYYNAKLEHLGCFVGGMLALGSRLLPERRRDLNVARRLTETCWWAYNSTLTGIGPEDLEFYGPNDSDRYKVIEIDDGTRRRGRLNGNPLVGVRGSNGRYQNRPETIESVLYMYRITGDPAWQERGWQMFASWMTHGLVSAGVAALHDVHAVPSPQADSMESFTLAETFKYYYLLFSPPNLVSFDDFVFTTEAHPLLAPSQHHWGVPGRVPSSFPHWTPPSAEQPGSAYTGGEHRARGGLTNSQKQEMARRLHNELPLAHQPQGVGNEEHLSPEQYAQLIDRLKETQH
ncbi:hypothetical protein MVES_001405 [Malassezia vespertilionis]|uniref:alpha-1,2-Mannosidase n=1 Tax=Malassezia vespertilionis TaxID=2020962 RepID=A0A2N1JCE7_9BASI|nr:hypothetical protein MVES_001405 [Malassezia vespertilionis]